MVKSCNIGGLCFFQGGPVRQANLTNYYQSLAKVPLMISIDGEWGLAMRLDSTIRFPRQMTLGAMPNEQMIYSMGVEIARQCKRIGIQVNLAPVMDINNNPLNPVISVRSFGENKFNVARKGILYMQGMQDNGVMANAKHFPGHGNTDSDSHLSLPVLKQCKAMIDTLELYPFRQAIAKGLSSMMVAHLYVPCYDSTLNTASTLSKKIVTDLLKRDLGFKGLIFTDALNMKGVSAYYTPGRLDVKALLAGNDVLLYSEDVPTAIVEIDKAIENKEISQDEIDQHVKKILAAKYWMGLNKYKPINLKNLYQDLNTSNAQYLDQQLFESSITLLRNNNAILPLKNLEKLNIASVIIGDSVNVPFNKMLANYSPLSTFKLSKDATKESIDSMQKALSIYNLVIVSIYNTNINATKNYGITDAMNMFIESMKSKTKVVVDVFGNPYTLSKLTSAENVDGLLMSYEGTEQSQSMSAQIIFGGVAARGNLPVTASKAFKIGDGLHTETPIRMKYTMPEELNIRTAKLQRIDTIINNAIAKGAMPGCQVLVAKDGKVIYNKSYGYQTYKKEQAVLNTDIYDIASITKIASTTMGLMKLYDDGNIDLNKKLSKLLPELKFTNKKNIVFRDMLTHQAGLQSWIPFWTSTVSNGVLMDNLYKAAASKDYPTRVAEGIYLKKGYSDTIWSKIIKSPLGEKGKYVYSDLGFITTKKIVEKQSKEPIDKFVRNTFYAPLGLSTMGFLPLTRFNKKRIVPTEDDTKFRKQLLQGDVHDPAAAMMGGIAGHAGIFSNANDLAILMQMLLQNGEYGGRRYLKETTVAEFTKQQFPKNRRALGFDKQESDPNKSGPVCKSASAKTFGHQGFTGTCVWVDPEYNLVYVFLSNRVNPDADNEKLVKMNVRTDVQQAIYNAIISSKQTMP
jgi:beta-N-acetylhexosaminidase